MNGHQPLDYKLEDEIIWVSGRKEVVKEQLREKITKKSKVQRSILNWERLKVSVSFVAVGLLCVILFANITHKGNDVQEIHSANSVSYKWHNLEIRPVLPPTNVKLFGTLESHLMMIESRKNFNLKDSQKRAAFNIMRPSDEVKMPLEVSRGVIEYPPGLSAKNFHGPLMYWDIWQEGDKWIYVRQSLTEESEQLLSKKGKKVIWKIHSNDKVIPFKNKDAIAITRDLEESGNRIDMYVKNQKKQVIHFEVRGNISDKELMKLAQSYLN
ncbi:hypothetical protein [Bacillus salipaludis]|uniref:DUF4367 domain-containing protein n=1 Tax=Bacillus salipaludis TaxID=2547811 RepID=A0ABW8RDZ9_9BACI